MNMSLKKSLCSLKPHIGTNFYPILKILIILFIPDPFSLFCEFQCLWVKNKSADRISPRHGLKLGIYLVDDDLFLGRGFFLGNDQVQHAVFHSGADPAEVRVFRE